MFAELQQAIDEESSDEENQKKKAKVPSTALELKPVHIKRTRKNVLQLFKNLFLFYDVAIEQQLRPGETILQVFINRLQT